MSLRDDSHLRVVPPFLVIVSSLSGSVEMTTFNTSLVYITQYYLIYRQQSHCILSSQVFYFSFVCFLFFVLFFCFYHDHTIKARNE